MSTSSFTAKEMEEFRRTGHITRRNLFARAMIQSVLEDLDVWSKQFIDELSPEDQQWYLERDTPHRKALRKLDHPAFHRERFRNLATHTSLRDLIQQIMGSPCHVFFSQVFMKPPEAGSSKPVHQDNFYFGPDDLDATLTVWIALDDATLTNGCLHYCNQHQHTVLPHFAPENEPYNLQIDPTHLDHLELTPTPIDSGGVSFHHGNTPHFSNANHSTTSRRAVAFHYLRNDANLTDPGLNYDSAMRVDFV